MNNAVAYDLSDWSVIEISGPDRAKFLHSFCTNDIVSLQPGQSCEAFIPEIKGRILGHVLVFVSHDRLTLLSVSGTNEAIATHLTKYLIGSDAMVNDVTSDRSVLAICGDDAVERMAEIIPTIPQNIGEHVTFESMRLAANVDIFSVPTILLTGESSLIEAMQMPLSSVSINIAPLDGFEAMRIAAGFPYHGRDISVDNIAQEAARTDRAISFTKGCYLGQEPIARLDALGHTNKELRGLTISGKTVPELGTPVTLNGAEVGNISSVATTQNGTILALAMLKSKATESGTQLEITFNGTAHSAEVYWPNYEA